MSSNEVLNQDRSTSADGQASSPWSGEARETWVSLAMAAATASLRATAPAANDKQIDSGLNADPA